MSNSPPSKKIKANPLFLRDKELRQAVELLFFVHRDFAREADQILANSNFGRAHHRVIYFVGANPGIIVSDLLSLLKITKQSLSRILTELLESNYLRQKTDLNDRRRRQLYLTSKGETLEAKLTTPQIQKIADAFRYAGVDAVAGFYKTLTYLANSKEKKPYSRDY